MEVVIQGLVLIGLCSVPLVRHFWNEAVEAGRRVQNAGSDYDESPHEWVMNSLPDDIKKELRRG